MSHLSPISRLVLALALSAALPGPAGTAQTPVPVPPPVDVTTTVQLPNGLTSTSTTTQLGDGLSGSVISTTIANPPIPDSPESRRTNGGPESATGRATLPQPGLATTVHPASKAHKARHRSASPPPVTVPMAADPPR